MDVDPADELEVDLLKVSKAVRKYDVRPMTRDMSSLLFSQAPHCSKFNFHKNEYESGDEAYIRGLKMHLFESVEVELLDHGHKIVHCWTPRDK